MTALSGDLMTGRRPGSPGYDAAAAYVIKESRSLGLKPGGIDNTYLQSIVFRRTQVDPTSTAFNVDGSPLTQATDFTLHPRETQLQRTPRSVRYKKSVESLDQGDGMPWSL